MSPDERNAQLSSHKAYCDDLANDARDASWETAKLLFAGNGGAAAGMLSALEKTAYPLNLIAFTFFAAGAGAVVISSYLATTHLGDRSSAAARVFEINFSHVPLSDSDIRDCERKGIAPWKLRWANRTGTASVSLFVIGAIFAGVAFFSFHAKDNHPQAIRVISVATNNTPHGRALVTNFGYRRGGTNRVLSSSAELLK